MQAKRELLASKGWVQATLVVRLCGFLLLGILAYRAYTYDPPIPSKVLGDKGELLFSGQDVPAGQHRYDEVMGTLTFSQTQNEAFNKLVRHYAGFFYAPDTRPVSGPPRSQTLSKSGN